MTMTATIAVPPMTSPSSPPRSGRVRLAGMALALPLLLVACGGGGGAEEGPVLPPGTGIIVGGTVSGLATGGSVALLNSGADELTVAANGRFVMGRRYPQGFAYAITIASQPAGQRCSVAQGAGNAAVDVTTVAVTCETLPVNTHLLGGQVTGLLTGQRLMLQNNQGDDLVLTGNGRFFFGTPLAGGSAYAVRVQAQPAGQTCSVASASGTVANAHVPSVQVACAAATPTELPEGGWASSFCSPGSPEPSRRNYVNIQRTGDASATLRQGYLGFSRDVFCGGTGAVAYDDRLQGSVAFDRKESRGDITAFWGLQSTSAGSKRVVWARKGPYLCLLPRATVLDPNPPQRTPRSIAWRRKRTPPSAPAGATRCRPTDAGPCSRAAPRGPGTAPRPGACLVPAAPGAGATAAPALPPSPALRGPWSPV
jgi:hypothetical protein